MNNPVVLVIGGVSDSLINFRGPLLARLVELGYEVHAAANGLDADLRAAERLAVMGVVAHPVPLSRTGLSPIEDLRLVWSLWRLMRQIRPDAVLGYTIKPVIWGLLAAWLAGVPRRFALITGLGYAFASSPGGNRTLVQRLASLLYRLSIRRASLVFFQNPDDEREFRQWGILPGSVPSKVVHGSGVEVDDFALADQPTGPVRFLLIARLLGDKGVREYVAAAKALRTEYPQAQWHLVGGLDPNPNGIARAEVEAWQDEGWIHWHGSLDDVRPAIAASHVYVLPSYYREGTPRTILEAMAMGRAVITTDAPGCRETVRDGDNGFLVAPRDVGSLVRAMRRLLEDPALIARMGLRSRRIAEEKYDVHKVNAAMLQTMGLL